MQIIDDLEALREARRALPGRVGFVPTMGFLHEGHLSLMRLAREHVEHLIVSIYVNPTQFGEGEDLESYPRDLQADAAACQAEGCELLFTPSNALMYPPGHATVVTLPALTQNLCAPHRPVHFSGVATIVTKLFLLVEPDVAVFGQKDYQQLTIIRQLVRDLHLEVEILAGATTREADGLALSSRNAYLTSEDRQAAVSLSSGLRAAWDAWQGGERDGEALVRAARRIVLAHVEPEAIDYIEAVHPMTLSPYVGESRAIAEDAGCVVALAVRVGAARLIDNLRLDGPLPEEMRT